MHATICVARQATASPIAHKAGQQRTTLTSVSLRCRSAPVCQSHDTSRGVRASLLVTAVGRAPPRRAVAVPRPNLPLSNPSWLLNSLGPAALSRSRPGASTPRCPPPAPPRGGALLPPADRAAAAGGGNGAGNGDEKGPDSRPLQCIPQLQNIDIYVYRDGLCALRAASRRPSRGCLPRAGALSMDCAIVGGAAPIPPAPTHHQRIPTAARRPALSMCVCAGGAWHGGRGGVGDVDVCPTRVGTAGRGVPDVTAAPPAAAPGRLAHHTRNAYGERRPAPPTGASMARRPPRPGGSQRQQPPPQQRPRQHVHHHHHCTGSAHHRSSGVGWAGARTPGAYIQGRCARRAGPGALGSAPRAASDAQHVGTGGECAT